MKRFTRYAMATILLLGVSSAWAQQRDLEVTMDVAQNANAGDSITATLNAFGTNDLRNLDNNTFLTPSSDVVPTGAISGNPMTIQAAALAASLSATPVSQSFVKGTQGVDFVGLNLKAGDATNVTVTEVDTTGFIDENGGGGFIAGVDNSVNVSDDILVCRLMDGATQLGQSKSPASATGVMNFTNVNVAITAGMTKSLKVNCDISNSAFRNSDVEKISFHVTGVETVGRGRARSE